SFVFCMESMAREMASCASAKRPHETCARASHTRLNCKNTVVRALESPDKLWEISLTAPSPLLVAAKTQPPNIPARSFQYASPYFSANAISSWASVFGFPKLAAKEIHRACKQ